MDDIAVGRGRAAGDRLLAGDQLRRRGEAEVIEALVELAASYRLDEDELTEALVERRIRPGGVGTPTVSEFLSLEIAGLLGCTSTAAAGRLADALNLRYRHPRLYEAVQRLEIDAARALKAASRCCDLHPVISDAVTAAWLAQQKGKGWTAAFNALDRLIVEADTELAAEKERKAREDRGVWTWGAFEGAMNITGKLDVIDARLVDDRLSLFADLIEPAFPGLTHAQRRAKAMGVLTDPYYAVALLEASAQPALEVEERRQVEDRPVGLVGLTVPGALPPRPLPELVSPFAGGHPDPVTDSTAAPPPGLPTCGSDGRALPSPARHRPTLQVAVHIHSDAVGAGTGVARVERAGIITQALLRELISEIPGLKVRVQPVIDLPQFAPADGYVPTAVMRRAALLAFPHEPFPFSDRSSEGLDLDHTVAYQPGRRAQTRIGNLAPLARRVHRAKTAGFWVLAQPTPGQLVWTSPLGYRYDVTSFGSRRLVAVGSDEALEPHNWGATFGCAWTATASSG